MQKYHILVHLWEIFHKRASTWCRVWLDYSWAGLFACILCFCIERSIFRV